MSRPTLNGGSALSTSPVTTDSGGSGATAELQGHEYAYDHRCVRIVNGEVCYRSKDDPVHQKSTTTACRCHEAPEAWRWCPLPEHDHEQWTEHGWNCPASCEHPNAVAVRRG